MDISLAATWNPRGEFVRFQRLLPQLEQAYAGIVIVYPPITDARSVKEIQHIERADQSRHLLLLESKVWAWGRYLALQKALELPTTHIQYADFDRLLRWVETCPDEWRQVIARIQACECLVIGRTATAYATHPQALVHTEAISNQVISFLLGRNMDVSAGSKGFSRRAAEFLVANASPGHALGTDGEWPVLLHHAGFGVDYIEVDGLDWESADRYQERAASLDDQRRAAKAYDADPQHWAMRAEVALEIVTCGLAATRRS